MNDKLPALQGVTSSELIAWHLSAMHSAPKAFICVTRDIMEIIYNSKMVEVLPKVKSNIPSSSGY